MLLEQGFENFGRVGSLKKINKSLIKYTFSSSNNKKASDKEALKDLEQMKSEIETSYRGQDLPFNVSEEYKSILCSIEEIKNGQMQTRIQKLLSKRVIGATCASTNFQIMK